MLKILLGRHEDKRIRSGHPWVFSNEIRELEGDKKPGASVDVHDCDGRFVGTGYYNPSSLIAVRIVSRQQIDLDTVSFFRERIQQALAYRQSRYPGATSFRAVFSEGDMLPGLIVDKYGDYLAVQFLTQGIETRRHLVISALREVFSPRGIIARNDVAVRTMEGLPEKVEILHGEVPEHVEVEENGLFFRVDMHKGQKTGHFFDQKDNHLLLEKISRNKDVLDCFCYSGSWGIHAAHFGAASVTYLDISARAIALARQNAIRNGLAIPMEFEPEDVFERLRSLKSEGKRYDLAILDPPAFVKNKKTLKEAEKGYLTINRRAMELLRKDGYLVTCSCSYHMGREAFRDLLVKAAALAGKELRIVAVRSQAHDHPILLAVPETEYLKCFVLQVV